MTEVSKCHICGEPMGPHEQMFKFHGYSGPCPKPPLPKKPAPVQQEELKRVVDRTLTRYIAELEAQNKQLLDALKEIADDYADRFDLDSPSTNPGIKFTIKQARAAIAQVEGSNDLLS